MPTVTTSKWRALFARMLRQSVPLLLITALAVLVYKNERASQSWGEFNLAIIEFSGYAGLLVAVGAARSFAREDNRFLAATSGRTAGFVRAKWLQPLLPLYATYTIVVVVGWYMSYSNGLKGSPWWDNLALSFVWIFIVSPAIGALPALALRSRPLLAVLTSVVLYLGVQVSLIGNVENSYLPRISVFWPSGYTMDESVDAVLLYPPTVLTILLISLIFCGAVWLAWRFYILGSALAYKTVAAIAVAVMFSSGLIVNVFTSGAPMYESRPPVDDPICIVDPQEALTYCDWPENNKALEALNVQWPDYVSEMRDLGFVAGGEIISSLGVMTDSDIELDSASNRSVDQLIGTISAGLIGERIRHCSGEQMVRLQTLRYYELALNDYLTGKYGDGQWRTFDSSIIPEVEEIKNTIPAQVQAETLLRCAA